MRDRDAEHPVPALNARLLAASGATEASRARCDERGLGGGGIEARLHRAGAVAHPPRGVAERLRCCG